MNEKTDQPHPPLLEHMGIARDSMEMMSGRVDNIQKIFTERINLNDETIVKILHAADNNAKSIAILTEMVDDLFSRVQKLESAAGSRPSVDIG